jgi:hypothetical protein
LRAASRLPTYQEAVTMRHHLRGRAMLRLLGPLLAAGVLAGCAAVGDGSSSSAGAAGPGIRWSGPYGSPVEPLYGPGGYGYRSPVDPFPSWRYGGNPYGDGGGRTFRPGRDVVCDRATRTCYRDGEVDASETRDNFGRRAARQVDRIRDAAGTNRIFRPDDDVVCNRRDKVCFKNGHPDRSETRDFFGKKAARRID